MSKIVLSYRRSDSQAVAGRIFDRLTAHFGAGSVFMDVDDIPFGIDFRQHIQSALSKAAMLLAVVGPDWVGSSDGRNRIDEADDPVRVEIETALRQKLLVIPVLINNASMPKPSALPGTLRDFAFLNAAPVDVGRDFGPHVDRLIRSIEQALPAATGAPQQREPARSDAATTQQISYCRAPDGVRLAYAAAGSGPPLVKAANWLNHLEYDWESPIWRHTFRGLARDHTLIRYDARGNGMSDWDVAALSLNIWVSDLETVVDAAGVGRFTLLGISQGCAISVAYAVRHPERVSHLILYGGFALGPGKRSPADNEKRKAMTTLMRLGWGSDNPAFRQLFTALFIPGATKEQADLFSELQRKTTSPECAARYFEAVGDFDIRDMLSEVKSPTLVMHARGDLICPIEAGRELATGIPGARFVALQGQNHLFLEHEPAADRFFDEIKHFLGT